MPLVQVWFCWFITTWSLGLTILFQHVFVDTSRSQGCKKTTCQNAKTKGQIEQEKDKKRNRRMNRRHQINKRRCNRRTSWYTGQTLGTVRWTDDPLFSSAGMSCRGRARKTVAPDDPTVWVGTPSVYPTLSLNSYRDAPRRSLQHRMIRRLGQDEASVYPTVV
jgi:hypothetical protein